VAGALIPVFGAAWAVACADQLRARPEFRAAAARWEGVVMLTMTGLPADAERRVYLDLFQGECREARAGTSEDEATARLVFSATAPAWQQMLSGKLAPLHALLTGKLVLSRGNIMELAPYASLANQLVQAAGAIPADYGA
jgi:putative sterol carrier protein